MEETGAVVRYVQPFEIEELLYKPCFIAHKVMFGSISKEEVSQLAQDISDYVYKKHGK